MNLAFLCKYTIQNASNYISHHSTQRIQKLKAWQSPGGNSHPSCCLLPSVSKAACKQPQMLCHTVLHTIDITTNFGMQLVLNTQYLLAKYLEHFSSSASHSIAHFKADPSLHQAPQQCFPCRWKGAFPCPGSTLPQQAPCWDVDGALQKNIRVGIDC